MSGPKTARIEPSLRRQARERLGPLLEQLRSIETACSSLGDASSANNLPTLTTELGRLRAELAAFRPSPSTRRELLDAAFNATEVVKRLESALRDAPSQRAFEEARAELVGMLTAPGSASIDASARRAETLISAGARAAALHPQVKSSIATVRSLLSGSLSTATANHSSAAEAAAAEQARREIADASRHSVDAEAREATSLDDDARLLGTFDATRHAERLAGARHAIDSGDLARAAGLVSEAREARLAAVREASELRRRIAERDIIAAHLADALRRANYDECASYLLGEDAPETAPLVLYANNPSGSAHVRLTLHLDGRMGIDVDGVAAGEEQVCLDLLATFARTLSGLDETFTIVDLGTAESMREKATEIIGQIQKERGAVESERMKAPEILRSPHKERGR